MRTILPLLVAAWLTCIFIDDVWMMLLLVIEASIFILVEFLYKKKKEKEMKLSEVYFFIFNLLSFLCLFIYIKASK